MKTDLFLGVSRIFLVYVSRYMLLYCQDTKDLGDEPTPNQNKRVISWQLVPALCHCVSPNDQRESSSVNHNSMKNKEPKTMQKCSKDNRTTSNQLH